LHVRVYDSPEELHADRSVGCVFVAATMLLNFYALAAVSAHTIWRATGHAFWESVDSLSEQCMNTESCKGVHSACYQMLVQYNALQCPTGGLERTLH
jgi:hypothetical protein